MDDDIILQIRIAGGKGIDRDELIEWLDANPDLLEEAIAEVITTEFDGRGDLETIEVDVSR